MPGQCLINRSQIEWFRNASASINPIERPFQPDGANDLDGLWRKRSQPSRLRQRDETRLAKPNAIMWFHIPLPEAYDPADSSSLDGSPLDVGDQLDWAGSSPHNGGFFYKGIKALDAEEAEGTGVAEVKVLSHGHCHITDRCRRVGGIWWVFPLWKLQNLMAGCALTAGHHILVMASWALKDE